MKSLLLGLALLLDGCTQTVRVGSPVTSSVPPESAPDPFGSVAAKFAGGHPREALRLLEDGPELGNKDARALYLAGYAWLRLHRPDLAKPLLEEAAGRGFNGYPGWESTGALRERIAVIEQLRPPAVGDARPPESSRVLRAYADDSPWIGAVVKTLPEFVRRAHAVFGQDLPPIDVYLFRSRDAYNRFYKALFGVEVSTWWQNGTGDSNVVVFCQEDQKGKPLGPPGAPRGLGDVLHEYSHALLNTLYGDGYLRHVPQWLDEGLSDFLARPYYGDLFATSAVGIAKALAKSPLPSIQELSRRLYERDSFLRYSVARFMVDEMMTGRDTSVIREILKRAAPEGDFDAAILAATGVRPHELRERVIARFR